MALPGQAGTSATNAMCPADRAGIPLGVQDFCPWDGSAALRKQGSSLQGVI